jgi:hypothetical protein
LDGNSINLFHDKSQKTSEQIHWHLNDGIVIHGERKASSAQPLNISYVNGLQAFNGVMYLIDGTIEV